MIQSKRVIRYFAPYRAISGSIANKGFMTLMASARFLARQDLLDKVFGEKFEHDNSFFDGYRLVEWSQWHRDVPDDKAKRIAMFAKVFPLEDCESPGGFGYFGEPLTCGHDCETHGYARCLSRKYLDERAKFHYDQFRNKGEK